MQLEKKCPIFPLGIVVFPGNIQSLQIFEPRYLKMVKECLNSDSGFVITLQNPNIDSFKDKGTYVKVIDFNNLPNGLLGITVKAINRVEIKSIETDADNLNFGDVIAPILAEGITVGLTNQEAAEELEYLRRFRYEFFSVNAGSAIFKGTGTSIKKTATNTQRQGTAYRIYGCGYLMPRDAADDEFADPDILIPLESLIILSS